MSRIDEKYILKVMGVEYRVWAAKEPEGGGRGGVVRRGGGYKRGSHWKGHWMNIWLDAAI